MKKYIVKVAEVHYQDVEVSAENPEAARPRVAEGAGTRSLRLVTTELKVRPNCKRPRTRRGLNMKTYDVYLYPVVYVKVPGIKAATPEAAAKRAEELVALDTLFQNVNTRGVASEIQYADDIDGFLVDEINDAQGSLVITTTLDRQGRKV